MLKLLLVMILISFSAYAGSQLDDENKEKPSFFREALKEKEVADAAATQYFWDNLVQPQIIYDEIDSHEVVVEGNQ